MAYDKAGEFGDMVDREVGAHDGVPKEKIFYAGAKRIKLEIHPPPHLADANGSDHAAVRYA